MPPEIHLLDLIRREKLDNILQGFTEVAGIASIIADVYGRPLTKPHNFTSFCFQYCRSTKEGKRRCHLSDRHGGLESLRTDKPPIYHCLNAGLMDCAAPVIVGGRHIATVLCGQVLDEPIKPDLGRERALAIGVKDIAGYLEALQTVPLMDRERLLNIANLMAVITQTISELALQKHLQHKHSQKYLHKLINSVSDCIISTNFQGIISMINEAGAEMFGYEVEELVGKSITSLFLDGQARETYQSQMERKTKSSFQVELNAIRADREFFPVHVSVAGIHRGDTESADYVTVVRDISEQRKIERMKEDLIGMVAHDIKNPVLSIQRAMELLVNGALGPLNLDQIEVMRLALDTSHQLFGMVSNLLDIYRRENGQFLLYKTVFDLNEVIDESIGHSRLLAQDKRVNIHFEPYRSFLKVEGDRVRLARTCINLLENAVKYSREGSDVVVTSRMFKFDNDNLPNGSMMEGDPSPLRRGASYARVTVSDRGAGIAKEYLNAVFEKFFTIESKKTQARKSLGLGLTFCKQVVEAHGGAIWVKSPTFTTPGGEMRGCDFEFLVPLERSE